MRNAPGRIRRLLTARRANSTILVALSSVPVVAMVSLAVDYGMARNVRGKLDLAADSAAIQATSAASDAYLAGAGDAMEAGIAAARARFTAQTAGQGSVEISPVHVALSQTGGLFNATVSYQASMSTTLARVIGIESLPIAGQASASLAFSPPVDIQVLVDTSASMLVAATAADRGRLERLTAHASNAGAAPGHVGKGEACGFACHWSETAPDFYDLAIRNHIPLRLDAVRDAMSGLIKTMGNLDADQRFQIGLYSFSQNFNSVVPLTHDLSAALQGVARIVPGLTECTRLCADTSFHAALQALAATDATLPHDGDATPQRFLFVVTDGVRDEPAGTAAEIGPVSPEDCTAVKANGVIVLVLYTPYPAMPGNALYSRVVAPVASRVLPALQGCASSPAYVFSAGEPAEINSKLQAMLRVVLRSSSRALAREEGRQK